MLYLDLYLYLKHVDVLVLVLKYRYLYLTPSLVPMVPIQASGTYTERDLRQVPMSPKPARGQSEQI